MFFDEIHELREWSSKVKLLYDNLSNARFVLSGSASAMLERETASDLAGRCFLREVEPLSLREFAELSGAGRWRMVELPLTSDAPSQKSWLG